MTASMHALPGMVTRLVDEKPEVACFVDQSWLSFELSEGLKKEFSLSLFSLDGFFLDQNWSKYYKIFIFAVQPKKTLVEVLEKLHQFSDRLVVVVDFGEAQENIDILIKKSGKGTFIITNSLDYSPSGNLLGDAFLQLFSTQKIIDIGGEISYFDTNQALGWLSTEMRKPVRAKKMLYTGLSIPFSSLVVKVVDLYERYYQIRLDLEKKEKLRKPFPQELEKITEKASTSTLIAVEKLAEIIAKQLPFVSEKISEKTQLPKPKETTTKPVSKEKPTREVAPRTEVITLSASQDKSLFKKKPLPVSVPIPIQKLVKANDSVKSSAAVKKISIEKEIEEIFREKRVSQKIERLEKTGKKKKTITYRNKKRRKVAFVLFPLILGLIVLCLVSVSFFIIAKNFAFSVLEQKKQYLQTALVTTKPSQTFRFLSLGIGLIPPTPLTNQLLVSLQSDLQQAQVLMEAQQAEQQWQSKIEDGVHAFFSSKQDDANALFVEAKPLAQTSVLALEKLEKESELSADEKKLVATKKDSLLFFQKIQPLLSGLLGSIKTKQYAVVLQDDAELRPTGGFIQAVGLLRIKQGKLLDIEAFSSYQIDEKLRGVLSAPADMQKELGESRLFLRDVNWFLQDSEILEKFNQLLLLSQDTQVDGILFVNTSLLPDILSVTGPVYIPLSSTPVTANTVIATLTQAKTPAQKDSTQPTVQSELLESILNKFPQLSTQQHAELLPILGRQMRQKGLTFVLANNDENTTLKESGLSNDFFVPACPPPYSINSCVLTAVKEVDANVGINTINHQVEQTITENIQIGQDLVTHKRQITWKNTATLPYSVSVRFLMAGGITPTAIEIVDGEKLPYSVEVLDQKQTLLRFSLVVLPQTKKTVQIAYQQPFSSKNDAFVFFEQPQSGRVPTHYSTKILSPFGFSPQIMTPQGKVTDNSLLFAPLPNQPITIGVVFSKK